MPETDPLPLEDEVGGLLDALPDDFVAALREQVRQSMTPEVRARYDAALVKKGLREGVPDGQH